MFKLVANPTFTCPVKISVPGSDVPVVLQVTFKHKTARALAAWLAGSIERSDDATFLEGAIESIAGLGDAEGQPLPYSRQVLETLLDQFPASGAELVQAYRRQLADARAKN